MTMFIFGWTVPLNNFRWHTTCQLSIRKFSNLSFTMGIISFPYKCEMWFHSISVGLYVSPLLWYQDGKDSSIPRHRTPTNSLGCDFKGTWSPPIQKEMKLHVILLFCEIRWVKLKIIINHRKQQMIFYAAVDILWYSFEVWHLYTI